MKFLKSFKNSVLSSMFLISLIAVFVTGAIWISGEAIKSRKEIKELREKYYNEQKEIVKSEVNRAISYIEYRKHETRNELEKNLKERVYEAANIVSGLYTSYKGKKTDSEIKNIIREALRPIRFNHGRGYFYIYDMKGNNILLPTSPELEGKNLINLRDSRGLYTIKRAIKLINDSDEGFMEWHWYKPDDSGGMLKKIGFMKAFHPYNWFIGTGEYIEDFTVNVQNEALNWINRIRFENDGYIFLFDYQGNVLAHFSSKYKGKNLWDYKDLNGNYMLREMYEESKKEGGGFLEYYWRERPTSDRPGEKIAYLRNIDEWKWVVGAGIYIDEINDVIAEKQNELFKKIFRNFIFILLVLLICLFIIFRFSKHIAGAITENINRFNEFFRLSADQAVKINTDDIKFREFRDLAQSANMMTDKRNQAEEALKTAQEQLLRSRKMEALGLLAGGVAHDLNNVLSAVIGYPELILEAMDEEDPHRKYIQTILVSGKKAAAIVEDLLALARRGVPQPVLLDMNSIIEYYLRSPEHTLTMTAHQNVFIETELEPQLMKIRGSEIHIQKTVMNLINNAAEALPEGGNILIKTENFYADKPVAGYQQVNEGDYVLLKIADNGLGISSEDLQHIFEPFFTKKVMGRSGTGLGMAVVWGTVQDHNGSIDVETEEGSGTEFRLYFPATREESDEEIRTPEKKDYTGNGEYILVVDDIKEQRELSCEILHNLGYKAFSAKDASEAVEFIKNNRVDLVVLDMILEDPKIDGLETYKMILNEKPGQKAIIASGYAENERVKETIRLGAGQFLKKPYTIEKIGIAVKKELAD